MKLHHPHHPYLQISSVLLRRSVTNTHAHLVSKIEWVQFISKKQLNNHTHTTTENTAVSNSVQHRNSKLCCTLRFQFSSTSVCFVFDGINTHLHPNPFPTKQPLGPPTSAVIPAILSGDIRPISTFCRSWGFRWSFRLATRLRTRFLYLESVFLNSLNMAGKSRTHKHFIFAICKS